MDMWFEMDARDADKIADKLMQIRKKYEKLVPITDHGKDLQETAINLIDIVLIYNDKIGEATAKGWV